MSFTPDLVADAGVIIGNPLTVAGLPDNVSLAASLSLAGSKFSTVMPDSDETTGDYEIASTDHEKTLSSTDASAVDYTLPAGLTKGLKLRSYQKGAGQISYIAGAGATIKNGTPKSGGTRANGFYAEIENLGDDVWIVTGVLA